MQRPVSRCHSRAFQRGPTAGVEFDWRLASSHMLATILAGSYYAFLTESPVYVGHDAWISQLLEA